VLRARVRASVRQSVSAFCTYARTYHELLPAQKVRFGARDLVMALTRVKHYSFTACSHNNNEHQRRWIRALGLIMSKNYADALKQKPPPAPQNRRPDPKNQEAGAKRPRREKQPQRPPSTAEQNTVAARASAWGRPDAAVSAKKPPSILKRPKEEPVPVVKRPPSKKSKKPRPTQMSLGDVIPQHMISKKGKPTVTPVADTQPSQQEPQPMEVSSQEEFPSLSAGSAVASKPSKPSLPAHAGWGKKAPPKKDKPAVKKVAPKSTSKQQMQKESGKQSEVKKERTSLLDFGAKQRTDDGRGEHDLIRLLQDGKVQASQGVSKKGRQRITPRKKKFTTLKKKVLQERLEAWRKLHPEEQPATTSATAASAGVYPATDKTTCTVCLQNFAEAEEVEDDDEYEEIVENMKEMAIKVGPIRDAFLHREASGPCPAFVCFETPQSAAAACACWNGLVVGGQALEPVLLYPKLEESAEPVNNEKWRNAVLSAVSEEKDGELDAASSNASTSIILRNVLSKDDFEDEEHLEESLSYIRFLVDKHGTVCDFEAKQEDGVGIVIVTYKGDVSVAKEAVSKLDGLLVGGAAIAASLSNEAAASNEVHTVELKNALTDDDLEDEDCLKESLNDIESLAKSHGPLSDGDAVKVAETSVLITYSGDLSVAKNAAGKLDGTLLGGNMLQASVLLSPDEKQPFKDTSGWVLLQNILSEDDITDEECMEESIEDVRELASRYGKVLNVTFDPQDLTRVVRIEFDGGSDVAAFAAEKFNNMVLGGQTIAAMALSSESEVKEPATVESKAETGEATKPVDTTPKPLYSGDKLIPERFAECKRVPKVVKSTGPREYASLSKNEDITPLLIEMLGELMRLQRRAIEDKNAKARRRIVMGLREVARGIRAHKVKMVVMANNVDQYGAIDEKLQEILDLARQEDVPVIFELNKRKLGKAVGKSIKVSVVGIQSADGAHQQFKKLAALAAKT